MTKRKLNGYPLWTGHYVIGKGQRVGGVWNLPIKVVVHRRRMMLWALLTGRVRLSRP